MPGSSSHMMLVCVIAITLLCLYLFKRMQTVEDKLTLLNTRQDMSSVGEIDVANMVETYMHNMFAQQQQPQQMQLQQHHHPQPQQPQQHVASSPQTVVMPPPANCHEQPPSQPEQQQPQMVPHPSQPQAPMPVPQETDPSGTVPSGADPLVVVTSPTTPSDDPPETD